MYELHVHEHQYIKISLTCCCRIGWCWYTFHGNTK